MCTFPDAGPFLCILLSSALLVTQISAVVCTHLQLEGCSCVYAHQLWAARTCFPRALLVKI